MDFNIPKVFELPSLHTTHLHTTHYLMLLNYGLILITLLALAINTNATVVAYYEFDETQGGASNALNLVEGSNIPSLNNNWGNLNGSGQLIINGLIPASQLQLNDAALGGTIYTRIDFQSWNSNNESSDVRFKYGVRLKNGSTNNPTTSEVLNLTLRLTPENSILAVTGQGSYDWIKTTQNPSNSGVSYILEVNTDEDNFSVWIGRDSEGTYSKLKGPEILNLNGNTDFDEIDAITLQSEGGYYEVERIALANDFDSIRSLQSGQSFDFNPYQENTFDYKAFEDSLFDNEQLYNQAFQRYSFAGYNDNSTLFGSSYIRLIENDYFFIFPRRKNNELIYTLYESNNLREDSWSTIALTTLEQNISLDTLFWESRYAIDTNNNFYRVSARVPDDDLGDLPAARYVPSGYSFIWGDHFQGNELNSDNWFVGMKNPDSGDLIPGANGDYLLKDAYSGYVTEEDSFVQNGALILRNQKRSYTGVSPQGNFEYTSGWVTSMQKVNFNRGYIEVRAKFPSGVQVWPAIWLVSEDLIWGPEWDLWEYFGYVDPSTGYDAMGMHLMTGYEQSGSMWPNQDQQFWDMEWIYSYHLNYNAENWHTYGWEWTETDATWSINGKVVNKLDRNQSRRPELWPDENMYIILNNGVRAAAPTSGTTIWPNQLEIDYIELYQKN